MAGALAQRLDAELVRRGLARSRRRAAELVAQGRVEVGGQVAQKPSHPVGPDVDLVVAGHDDEYVSRAAHKLIGALDALRSAVGDGAPEPAGRACLDAGASTGGFTQVLLERGAAHVWAVDVGHGQIADTLLSDPRVTVREGSNVRDLTLGDLTGPPAGLPVRPRLVVADLSFISLVLVVPRLLELAEPGADLLVMVKPQFEVGRERLGSGGVVTSDLLRQEAVLGVAEAARTHDAVVRAVVPSPLPGPAGNREYFLWLVAGAGDHPPDGRPGTELAATDPVALDLFALDPGAMYLGDADLGAMDLGDADLSDAVRRAVVSGDAALVTRATHSKSGSPAGEGPR